VRHDFYFPVRAAGGAGYGGRGDWFPFGENVHEVPADEVAHAQFDLVLFQCRQHYEEDQFELLSPAQQKLPKIYLEHDPPQQHPTNTRHCAGEDDVLLVHVTPFNALMWDSGRATTRVIEHGVIVPENVRYTGRKSRGIVVVNNLHSRGRRLGADLFQKMREHLPLDLVGMGAEESGGLGEIKPMELAAFISDYRFFFNPIRYTSLGLAVIEAMTIGMPIVALATTEMATVIQNGVNGYADSDVTKLDEFMRTLLADAGEAQRLGAGARAYALERFHIRRFVRDWEQAFADATVTQSQPRRPAAHPEGALA
jgi:hypothetical protein